MAREVFDPGEFRSTLAPRRVVALAETGSTNDEALRLAREGAPDGTVVVADVQTAGRGRLGRGWWAEPGTALLASWVVRPQVPPDRWPALSLVAGVAAAGALARTCGLEVRLKWPNDLVVGERKLGGILAEAEVARFVVIGLGVTVSKTEFPPDLAGTATSVEAAGGRSPGRPALIAAILEAFASECMDLAGALARYRDRCSTLGRRVRVERAAAAPLEGLARDVDESGALIVVTLDGDVAVASGDVVHLRDAYR